MNIIIFSYKEVIVVVVVVVSSEVLLDYRFEAVKL